MNDVSALSPAVSKMKPDWELAIALMGGTQAMRQAGTTYLPQWPAETPEDYKSRLNSTFLFGAYKKTIETLSAKPFAKPMTWEDELPSEVAALLNDVTGEGVDFHTFAQDVFQEALSKGHCLILVDYPKVEGTLSVAQLKAAGIRPRMIKIRPEQVLGWRMEGVELSMLRYKECVTEPDKENKFQDVEVQQIRVWEKKAWAVYRQNAKKEWVLYEDGVNTMGAIPVAVLYGGRRLGYLMSELPLRDLAYTNVEHWQSSSDQRSILHIARTPIFAQIGVMPTFDNEGKPASGDVVIGSKFGIQLPLGADAKFVEHSGAAIGAGRQDLLDIEERMFRLGADMISLKTSGPTATHEASKESKATCELQEIAREAEDVFSTAVELMAAWLQIPLGEEGAEVKLYTDFALNLGSTQRETTLFNSARYGLISNQTYYEELRRSGTIAAEHDWDEEQDRMLNQMPAGSTGMSDDGTTEQDNNTNAPASAG